MRKVHSRDTTPEVSFRKALWAHGLRYKVSPESLPGKPDIVLPRYRLAIFIDGDYWHGNQWRRRRLSALEDQFPHTKTKDYWLNKIRRNMARDCSATAALLKDGWTVIRFWESDIRKNVEECVQTTLEAIRTRPEPNPYSLLPQRTYAEFFAGIGLMRMGLEREGWSIAFANDIDEQKLQMYKAQFPDADEHFVLDDIHKLNADEVPSVSLATASFPCNDLSLAGSRSGLKGKQSSAFWGFIDVIQQMGERKPPIVLLENVVGFLNSHKGSDFEEALLALNKLDYTVDAFIIDAARFVPQSRQRLFVVGTQQLTNHYIDSLPRESLRFYQSDLRPKALADFIFEHDEIAWSIRDLPQLPERTSSLADIIEDLPDDASEWWNRERAEYLLDQMSPRHRQLADEMIARNEWSYGTVFRRVRNGKSMGELRVDGIAGCLRTPRGGSGRQILFKAGYGTYHVRLLTPRECARLMGADEFAITVPQNQALFGFGDAVCVDAVAWIARYYLNPLVNELIRKVPLAMEVAR